MLTLEPIIVEAALKDAQKSLKIVSSLIETIQDLKSSNPELQFYVMSNIAQVTKTLWPICSQVETKHLPRSTLKLYKNWLFPGQISRKSLLPVTKACGSLTFASGAGY